VFEITILASNANQCNTETWTIDETEDIECVTIQFVDIAPIDDDALTATLKILE